MGPQEEGKTARQLVFDLAREPSFDPDEFLVSPCNETAYAGLLAWPSWPDRVMLLLGPAGAGKSHLAAIWAAHAGAKSISTHALPKGADLFRRGIAVVLEDCDRTRPNEADLFHLLNMVREADGWLLLTARVPPDLWGARTPDLLSRLRLAPSITIGHPDAVLIKSVILKLFADRQVTIDEDVVAYAARHCEQSLDAANRFVAAVDEEALASGRPVTRPLAAKILAQLCGE